MEPDWTTELRFGSPKEGAVVALPEGRISDLDAFLRGLPSERTRESYQRTLTAFTSFLGDVPAPEVTRRHVEAYVAHLENLGRAPATIRRVLATLSSYFCFLLADGVIRRNPMAAVRRPKEATTSPRRALSIIEANQLLDGIDTTTSIGLRDRVLVLLLMVQALRVSEALSLQVEDLDHELGHHVATIRGKGGTQIRVPLAADVHVAIETWLARAGIEAGPVLTPVLKGNRVQVGKSWSRSSAHRRIGHLADRAGLDRHVHPHLLRHTAATVSLASGVPLHQVQDLLRHRSPETTRRYDSHRLSLRNPAVHTLASRFGPSAPEPGSKPLPDGRGPGQSELDLCENWESESENVPGNGDSP